ncbi:MAG TPA: TetR/AcrR family transcriptional regulator [Solirubrobacteraceae bacterium]
MSPEGPSDHRARLIAAMSASVEEQGYRETTVADVVRLARTSRRSFYEHFEDRDACYLALFDAVNDALMAEVATAVNPEQPWEQQVDQALGAYLDSIAAQPALSRSFVRELPALGASGSDRQLAVIERFAAQLVGLVELGRREQPGTGVGPLTHDMAVMIVGGLRELTVISIQQGRDVRELRPVAGDLVKAILRETRNVAQTSRATRFPSPTGR